MGYADIGQVLAHHFVVLDRHRTDEDWLAPGMQFLYMGCERFIFSGRRLEDKVVVVDTFHRAVRGNDYHVESVHGIEFLFRGEARTGHAGELLVHAEIVLECHAGIGARLALHAHTLLGLNSLMQAFGPAAARLQPSGEFVNDEYLCLCAIGLHHVFFILIEERFGAYCSIQVVRVFHATLRVEIINVERVLGLVHALFGYLHGLLLLVHGIVLVFLEGADDLCEALIQTLGIGRGARDDERRAGFVDEDRVYLIDNSEVVSALVYLRRVVRSVVP